MPVITRPSTGTGGATINGQTGEVQLTSDDNSVIITDSPGYIDLSVITISGQQGEQGVPGVSGVPGVPGTNGADGAKGDQGEPGISGVAGIDGTGGGSGESLLTDIHQVNHGFSVGNVIRVSGANTYTKALADSAANAEAIGIVTEVADGDNFSLTDLGFTQYGVPAVAAGTVLFLDDSTAGLLTSTEPTTAGHISKPVAIVRQNATLMEIVQMRGSVIATSTQVIHIVPIIANSIFTELADWTTVGEYNLDKSDYPDSTFYFLVAGCVTDAAYIGSYRLRDITTNPSSPDIIDTRTTQSIIPGTKLISSSLTLPTGEKTYEVQMKISSTSTGKLAQLQWAGFRIVT